MNYPFNLCVMILTVQSSRMNLHIVLMMSNDVLINENRKIKYAQMWLLKMSIEGMSTSII